MTYVYPKIEKNNNNSRTMTLCCWGKGETVCYCDWIFIYNTMDIHYSIWSFN